MLYIRDLEELKNYLTEFFILRKINDKHPYFESNIRINTFIKLTKEKVFTEIIIKKTETDGNLRCINAVVQIVFK